MAKKQTTVGALKKMLAQLPDDAEVEIKLLDTSQNVGEEFEEDCEPEESEFYADIETLKFLVEDGKLIIKGGYDSNLG